MENKITMEDIFAVLAKPAIRALQSANISSIESLCAFSEKELLSLHGFGKNGLARVKDILDAHGLSLETV